MERRSNRGNDRGKARGRSDKPRSDKPRSDKPRSDRPRRDEKSTGERSFKKPYKKEFKKDFRSSDKARGEGSERSERSDRPRSDRPRSDRPRSDRRDDRDRRIKKDFHKDPLIPDEITGEELEKNVRGDLLTLSADNATIVAKHLACVNLYALGDPDMAYEHAMAASRHAGRVAMVRETAGYAAYRVGKYDVAIKELRAAFRINGDPSIWPVLADCERGLGKPERALQLAGAPEVKKLQKEQAIEMRIVAAGARRDMGDVEAAVVTLQSKDLNTSDQPWSLRLRYAYADALAAAGRGDEAKKWFAKAAESDVDNETDASERC